MSTFLPTTEWDVVYGCQHQGHWDFCVNNISFACSLTFQWQSTCALYWPCMLPLVYLPPSACTCSISFWQDGAMSKTKNAQPALHKVIMVGSGGVGKSALTLQFMYDEVGAFVVHCLLWTTKCSCLCWSLHKPFMWLFSSCYSAHFLPWFSIAIEADDLSSFRHFKQTFTIAARCNHFVHSGKLTIWIKNPSLLFFFFCRACPCSHHLLMS